jgi:hypothetical protein
MTFPNVCTRFIRFPASSGIEGSCESVTEKTLSTSASTRFISVSKPSSRDGGFSTARFGAEPVPETSSNVGAKTQAAINAIRVMTFFLLFLGTGNVCACRTKTAGVVLVEYPTRTLFVAPATATSCEMP